MRHSLKVKVTSLILTVAVLVSLAVVSPSFADSNRVIKIADDNLKAAIHKALGHSYQNFGKDITESEILQLKDLKIINGIDPGIMNSGLFGGPNLTFYGEVRDLTGLEEATNLKKLTLQGCELKELPAPLLSMLVSSNKITQLNLSGNQLTDLSQISQIKTLTNLNLNHNRLSSLNGLVKLKDLRYLELSGNQIKDIAVIANLPSLRAEYLKLADNQIMDFSALPKEPNECNGQAIVYEVNKASFANPLLNCDGSYANFFPDDRLEISADKKDIKIKDFDKFKTEPIELNFHFMNRYNDAPSTITFRYKDDSNTQHATGIHFTKSVVRLVKGQSYTPEIIVEPQGQVDSAYAGYKLEISQSEKFVGIDDGKIIAKEFHGTSNDQGSYVSVKADDGGYIDKIKVFVLSGGKVTVEGGTLSTGETEACFVVDTRLKLKPTIPEGKEFVKWDLIEGKINLNDVTAEDASFKMIAENIKLRAVYKDRVYAVTVDGGTTNKAEAIMGDTVTLTADDAPEGKLFNKWIVDQGGITLNDASSASITFAMPASDVKITAEFKDKDLGKHSITVIGGTPSKTEATTGEAISITLGDTPEGKVFDKWTVDQGGITLNDASSASTTFTMPASDVKVTAMYIDKASDNNSNHGSSGGSNHGSSGGSNHGSSGGSNHSSSGGSNHGSSSGSNHGSSSGSNNASNNESNDQLNDNEKNKTDNDKKNNKVPTYSDVSPDAYYFESVEYLTTMGALNGTGNDAFSPNQKVNRAMIVTVLYRLKGEPANYTASFDDVVEGAWYYDAVAWAQTEGIVNGKSDTAYAPLDTLTEEQILTILYRYLSPESVNMDVLQKYSNQDLISDYAKEAYAWGGELGIVKISDTGKLMTKTEISRADLANMVYQMIALNTADAQ